MLSSQIPLVAPLRGIDSCLQSSCGPLPQNLSSRRGSGLRRHTVGQDCTAEKRTNQRPCAYEMSQERSSLKRGIYEGLAKPGSGDSQGFEVTVGHPFICVPDVIPGEVDVLPVERSDMLKQSGIEGAPCDRATLFMHLSQWKIRDRSVIDLFL